MLLVGMAYKKMVGVGWGRVSHQLLGRRMLGRVDEVRGCWHAYIPLVKGNIWHCSMSAGAPAALP